MSDGLDVSEFLSGYLIEVDEHLSSATTRLLGLEERLKGGGSDPRAVRELFRSLHTVKGLSAMVGVEPVVELSHEMEALLRGADRAGGRLEVRAVEALLEGVRAIEERVRQLAARKPVAAAPRTLVEALHELRGEGQARVAQAGGIGLEPELLTKLQPSEREQLLEAGRTGKRAIRLDFVPSPERAARGWTITSVRERLATVGELVKVFPRAVPASAEAPGGLAFTLLIVTGASDAEVAAQADLASDAIVEVALTAPAEEELPPEEPSEWVEGDEETQAPRVGHVRVEVSRLDDALEKLSALVVGRFKLRRAANALAERGADVRELNLLLQENGRQLRDLRSSIMRARMVPVANMLERVPLVVRGLARSTGKSVRLDVHAGRAELDKAVAEKLFPAIVHLVRNAVDHAIETPADRVRAGKSEEGSLTVSAHERADNRLELSVRDDGRGIDARRVAERAGVPVPATPSELLELLCRPGLSTMQTATHTSGRGMGMDIVRKIAVEVLGGELLLETSPAGTTFTVRVPLSLTIVDAFSFTCADHRFVVPVASVEEIIEVDPAKVSSVPTGAGVSARATARLLQRRGQAVPLLPLSEVFGLPGNAESLSRKALVVRRNGEPFAFGVERMLGQQEVVVRPLEDPLVQVSGVVGSTDLGDGRPTLVLDLVALTTRGAGRVRA